MFDKVEENIRLLRTLYSLLIEANDSNHCMDYVNNGDKFDKVQIFIRSYDEELREAVNSIFVYPAQDKLKVDLLGIMKDFMFGNGDIRNSFLFARVYKDYPYFLYHLNQYLDYVSGLFNDSQVATEQ